jgi:2-polyprenyl-6-methoxyphenol hydroxylase-like FAD-dependent oxidoreductase
MSRFEGVVVVGAGPVGFLCALGVARAGVPVMVIEAEAGINDSPRAAVYFPNTLRILDRLGLLADVEAVAYKSTTFSYRLLATREAVHVDTSSTFPADSPYRYNAHFGQHILAQIVSRHLLRLPHATCRWNTRLTGLRQDDTGVVLTVSTPDGEEEIRADWVVGADGARSSVRSLLGLPFEGHTWPERFVATNVYYDFDRYGFEPANMIADPVHWAVVARLGRENMWRVTYAENAEIDEAEVARRIPEHYAAILPDPSVPYRIVAASPYRVHERCAATFRIGRVLLAGDAAHACNPCGGMGLTGGVIDSRALVEVLPAVIAGRLPDSALDFYSEERRRVFREVTSPIATQYKQRMCEPDGQRRRADFEEFRRTAQSPEQALMATQLSKLIEGNPMPA